MNDVLYPAPLLICESLIVRLEAFDVAAVVTVARLAVDSHGFDHAADDSAFGALDGWLNVARGMPDQGLDVLAGQFHSPTGAAVDVQ
ncbi:hypothetical protein M4D54_13435 [Brachybacterium sp. p3-SID1565]|uniref:hypothetical protein n=1 Tax=Brachybacterium sp. p3-SID1565 TaxID=2916046 RepID=UPI0021A817C9|nr:hypothetical protein [Brachybacterium sp. p3-SID1565]MCT1386607.1 hypothetical protein [Brachybacterium sp. p3-SID1565]